MKGRVRWDEANLGEIEANKPVRQKITEPKTPYHRRNFDDGSFSPVRGSFEDCTIDTVSSDMICSALGDAVASSSGKNSQPSSGWTWSDDEADPMDQDVEVFSDSETDGSGMTFNEHRRSHYDEYWKVKELMQNRSNLEDEDNEDGDDKNVNTKSTLLPPPAEAGKSSVNVQHQPAGPTTNGAQKPSK